ncbi:hypothetical protein RISK_001942 [Rhodopirellula islandica]|uniref:Transmembrane protein n=1 Tax=Rhodopirellula islandica TaxID=595434 RepID=A0A0J1BHS0_RHOIS|nr:hypothetical protein RISK_001942 [Rhodopirellula islandica]
MAIAGSATPYHGFIVAAIIVVLAFRTGWSFTHLPEQGRMLSADFAHLFGFPPGLASAIVSR